MKSRKAKVKADKPVEIEPAKTPAARTVRYTRDNNQDRFRIDPSLIQEIEAAGWKLTWCAEQLNEAGGKEHVFKQAMAQRLANGFTICLNSDFAPEGEMLGPLAQYSDTSGENDPVKRGGLVLMACPKEIAAESQKMDKIEAAEAIAGTERYKIEGVPGAMGGRHPSALNFNSIKSEREPLRIPGER